jgi:hypothetical protein
VYGSPYEESKVEFIDELHLIMGLLGGSTLLGGDFNLVRSQKEKNNDSVNFGLVELFINWIDRWGLIDLKDPSRLYTWTNNQVNPIMATLDMVLVSTQWEAKFPLDRVTNLPRGVSDHNPLLLNIGDKDKGKSYTFRFEKWWLKTVDFEDMVKRCWNIDCPHSKPIDRWQFKMRNLRKKIKEWSRNVDAELRKKRCQC